MSFAQKLIVNVPSFLLAAAIVIILALLSVGGILLMRRIVHHKRLKVHNDIAGSIFNTLGTVYAVLLAFMVVISWQEFDRSNLNSEKEANCLVDLYTDAQSFSETAKLEIRTLLKEYTRAIISDEWQKISQGQTSLKVEEILKKIWDFYSSYNPKIITEQVFFEESVHKLNELCELRRMRLTDSRIGIHPILWGVLIIGGLITIIFSFFFGSENLGAQIVMTVLLAIIIGLSLFTILELDFPFSGPVSISAEAFRRTLNFL